MPRKYSVKTIETKGVEAVAIFNGEQREGWIMGKNDFVDYSGFAQLVFKMADAEQVSIRNWSQ